VKILAAVVSIFSVFCLSTAAQNPTPESSGSISGRVTISGKGVAGISVTARVGDSPFENRTIGRATTDADGSYRLSGLPAGRFSISPIAKAYVVAAGESFKAPGQVVNVAENESIKNIDFALIRGGVITGRITDLEGRPIIGERVNVVSGSYSGSVGPMGMLPGGKNQTDDRGVYRIYGLPPGSYKVSVGQTTSAGMMNPVGMGGSQYARTYYPGVTDESKATAIEIKEGSETTNIDITPGKSERGFSASGRVVDAESGQPVANSFIGYYSLESGKVADGMNFTGSQSDANGKFRIEGMKPGRYAAFTLSGGRESSSSYSDPATFEISEADVTGIEIKLRRGGTIEGVAVIENNVDPAVTALLRSISLYAYVSENKGATAPSFSQSAINADGSFRLTGLSPGKASINMGFFPNQPKGLQVIRTELNGVDQPEGIEVTPGAKITGVRIVFSYGTTRIRGEVKIEGGVLPQGTALVVNVTASSPAANRFTEVDSRGHFLLENVPAGVYQLTVRSASQTPLFQSVTRSVTITNEVEVPVTMVIDLSKKVEPQ
jgi:protocatechuate 3,4-dioxygenase beta subunit